MERQIIRVQGKVTGDKSVGKPKLVGGNWGRGMDGLSVASKEPSHFLSLFLSIMY